jgi:hypothetical protein
MTVISKQKCMSEDFSYLLKMHASKNRTTEIYRSQEHGYLTKFTSGYNLQTKDHFPKQKL